MPMVSTSMRKTSQVVTALRGYDAYREMQDVVRIAQYICASTSVQTRSCSFGEHLPRPVHTVGSHHGSMQLEAL